MAQTHMLGMQGYKFCSQIPVFHFVGLHHSVRKFSVLCEPFPFCARTISNN